MLSLALIDQPLGTAAMTVPAAKVKTLCTDSEAALVRASRKGELETLSHAKVKQLAARARKLTTKWRDLKRGQSRAHSSQVGFGKIEANTKLKGEIFRDALASFEARLASLGSSADHATDKPRAKTKKDRSAEHRATRAAIRKGMIAAQDLVNSEPKAEAKPTAVHSAKVSAPSAKGTATVAKPTALVTKAAAPAKAVAPVVSTKKSALPKVRHKIPTIVNEAKQRQATTAAKHSRVARSGKTTRLKSHVKSSGKRAQARRDAKN
jgi:hypothetical protein